VAPGGLVAAFTGSVSSFLGFFSLIYWLLSVQAPTSFCNPMGCDPVATKLDAIYFTITTFTTTGYGDLKPYTLLARTVVTAQMVLGFVIISVLITTALGRISTNES
jgi:voltage-gated potassium channel